MNDSIENRMERIKKGKTTKSQRKLIEYLESVDYENIIYLSITELAEYTKVAEATILRFCRSLGFNGYQEFKLNMAQELSNARLKPGDSEYIRDISENYVDALEKCRKSLSSSAVDEAIECILSAKTVCCFGAGNSYVPALELHNRLMKMGIYSPVSYTHLDVYKRQIEDGTLVVSVLTQQRLYEKMISNMVEVDVYKRQPISEDI